MTNSITNINRPSFISHYKNLEEADDAHYPNSEELLSIGAPLGQALGLKRLGIHHETLPPGRRTSWPHAESHEEEFVYVLEGTPDLWIDGEIFRMQPGECAAFVPGTGIAHTMLNNTKENVRLLVVGEKLKGTNKVHYPLHPQRNEEIKDVHWKNCPERKLGPHPGLAKVSP